MRKQKIMKKPTNTRKVQNSKTEIFFTVITTFISTLVLQVISGLSPLNEAVLKVTKPIVVSAGEPTLHSDKNISLNTLEVEFKNLGFKKAFIKNATITEFEDNPNIDITIKQIKSEKIGWLSSGTVRVDFLMTMNPDTTPTTVQLHIFLYDDEGYGWLSDYRLNFTTILKIKGTLFKWKSVPNAEYYVLQVATDSSFHNIVNTITTSDTNNTYVKLKPFTKYYWHLRVKRFNFSSESPWSETSWFTTGQ